MKFTPTGLDSFVYLTGDPDDEVCAACGHVRLAHDYIGACEILPVLKFIYQDEWVMMLAKFEGAYFKHFQLKSHGGSYWTYS